MEKFPSLEKFYTHAVTGKQPNYFVKIRVCFTLQIKMEMKMVNGVRLPKLRGENQFVQEDQSVQRSVIFQSRFHPVFTLINWVWALRFICFALCKWCQLLCFAFQMVSEFVKGCRDRYAMNHIVVQEMLQSAYTNVIDTHTFFKLISLQYIYKC